MIDKLLSPVAEDGGHTYIYFAEYNDETPTLYEYDDEKNHYPFKDIDQTKVKNFGLIGNRLKSYFDISNGVFHLGRKEFKIKITNEETGKEIEYENCKKDLITFKQAHCDFSLMGRSKYNSEIESFNVGFKMNIDSAFIGIIFCIPVYGEDRRPYFGVKISDKNNKKYSIELIGLANTNNSKFTKKDIELKDGKSIATELYFN